MLRRVLANKAAIRTLTAARPLAFRGQAVVTNNLPVRGYYKNDVLMHREYGDGYMIDPHEAAERVIRVMALHDNVNDPSSITISHTFTDLGLNALDIAEVTLSLEREFDFEMPEDEIETWTTVNDIVEYISHNFYAK